MMSRRKFIAASVSAAVAMPELLLAARHAPFRLGLVADPQFADIKPAGTRFYRNSIAKLAAAVELFNTLKLDFCVNFGDLIDRDWESFGPILDPLKKSRHKFHHLLGNHDFDLADAYKAQVPRKLGLRQRYYSVQRGTVCCVMLDTTDVSVYAHPADAPESQTARAELEQLSAAGALNAKPWNSAVGTRQLQWFDRTCVAAARRGQQILVFAHHPVFPADGHNAWNAPALLEIVERNRNVVAWVNGHNHQGHFGTHSGVPFVTLRGMVETENSNAFAVLELQPDRLVITGHGREPSRDLPLRASAAAR
jgi:manganese-dependent ADP-ribose/CDP-alcohol diphosphatase